MCGLFEKEKFNEIHFLSYFPLSLSLSLSPLFFSLSLSLTLSPLNSLSHTPFLSLSLTLSHSPSHYAIIVISDIHGDTPLHAATSAGNEIILYLILTLIMIIITYLLILTN